jgi:hypothetical protein
MPIAIEQALQALQAVVAGVPIGTNLALLQLMWGILNGSFLTSRGAIFPALQESGFSPEEIRRSWQAMRYGAWNIDGLLDAWRCYIQEQGQWLAHEYEGYRPVAVDLTAFWRWRLTGWVGKYFNGIANRMLKGIGFAVVVDVGQLAGQRLPVLRKILRLAANCTARRNELPEYAGLGRRPQYGQLVRPLPRQRKGQTIEATEPDFEFLFEIDGRTIRAHSWHNLVLCESKVDSSHQTFSIWVFFDPLYTDPLVLATDRSLQPLSLFFLYLDRWPVEQVPLVAKQMLGLHRQFVFAPESCQRLPELAMLVGNILSYLALMLPPIPTGFWDRRPQKTTGRLRRVLLGTF